MNGLGLFANSLVSTTGNGRVVYGMPTPPAPGAAVSSGGSVPIGSIPYQIQWWTWTEISASRAQRKRRDH